MKSIKIKTLWHKTKQKNIKNLNNFNKKLI
jgi:hypothetical protein